MISRFLAGCLLLASAAAAAVGGAADIATISHGDRVDLASHLVPGKYVVFDFYADWCGPCQQLSPHLEALATSHADTLALRKIDVVNWGSDVASQHRLRSIPYLVLFGPDGRQLQAGTNEVLAALQSLPTGSLAAAAPTVAGHDDANRAAVPIAVAVIVAGTLFWLFFPRRRAAPITATAFAPPPPRSPASGWLVRTDAGIDGPFDERELTTLLRHRHLTPETPARRPHEREWTSLGAVLGKN